MAIVTRYVIEQREIDQRRPGGVVLRVTYYKEYYDDGTGETMDRLGPYSPEFAFAALPVALQTTLLTLNTQALAAFKAYLGSDAVTVLSPPEGEP